MYKTLRLPVVMYGCEALSLTLKGRWDAKDIKNRILRRILRHKRNYTGNFRRLHNKELNRQFHLHNIVMVIKCRKLTWAGPVSRMVEGRSPFKILAVKPIGKRFLWTSKRSLTRAQENILKCILKELVSSRGIGLIRFTIRISGESL